MLESSALDGRRALTAYAAGRETQVRLKNALSPQTGEGAWDLDAVCGVISATVTAGLLLSLDAEQLADAVGIAASETLGHRPRRGTDMEAFHAGKAASNGVIAAMFARHGFTGSRSLDAYAGFFTVFPPAVPGAAGAWAGTSASVGSPLRFAPGRRRRARKCARGGDPALGRAPFGRGVPRGADRSECGAAPMRDDVTQAMAEFAASPPPIPAAVWTMAKQMVLNATALSVGSAYAPALDAAYAAVRDLATPAEATVLGRACASAQAGGAPERHRRAPRRLRRYVHGQFAPSFGAGRAGGAGDGRGSVAPGRALLEGVIVGAELALRLGNGLGPAHFDRHWHVTGTMGHVGAAIAAARVAGLDGEAMRNAIGIGATEAAGIRSALGTMTKSFHPGKAAFDGIEAARLAAFGAGAPPDAIEGRDGLAAVLSGTFDAAAVLDGLGSTWIILENAFKPYACGLVSHQIIDAAIALRRDFASAEEIERIDVLVHPIVLDVMKNVEPRTGLEAKFSAYHCAAIGYLDGVAGPGQFDDARAVRRKSSRCGGASGSRRPPRCRRAERW